MRSNAKAMQAAQTEGTNTQHTQSSWVVYKFAFRQNLRIGRPTLLNGSHSLWGSSPRWFPPQTSVTNLGFTTVRSCVLLNFHFHFIFICSECPSAFLKTSSTFRPVVTGCWSDLNGAKIQVALKINRNGQPECHLQPKSKFLAWQHVFHYFIASSKTTMTFMAFYYYLQLQLSIVTYFLLSRAKRCRALTEATCPHHPWLVRLCQSTDALYVSCCK